MAAFNYNYKGLDYDTAQKQVTKQVDPIYQQTLRSIQQQGRQNQLNAGQVASARGLAHSGLAADQLNKVNIATQNNVTNMNNERSSRIAQMAQDLVNRDQDRGMQQRSQAYQEWMGQQNLSRADRDFDYQKNIDNRNFGYQKNVDDRNFNYQKGINERDFNYNKQIDADNKSWREYTYKNMSANDKAQLAWAQSQFGEDMAWKMFALKYQGELDKSMAETELNSYTQGFQEP